MPGPAGRERSTWSTCAPRTTPRAPSRPRATSSWVACARKNDAVILFDAAYEAYIQDPALPHSIYEIEGARECAIEFRSFSKSAGFTGVRCAYTVVPKDADRAPRQRASACRCTACGRVGTSTKFNGVPYLVQRAPRRRSSRPRARKQTAEQVAYYMANARRCAKACPRPASRSSAASTRPTSGCGRPGASLLGLLRPAAVGGARRRARPARASAPPARATCGSRPSTRARTSRRPWPHPKGLWLLRRSWAAASQPASVRIQRMMDPVARALQYLDPSGARVATFPPTGRVRLP